MKDTEQRKKSLKLEVLEKMGQLLTSGFGLVAALAWNDLIKKLFEKIFPDPGNNLFAMFVYAFVVTVLIVVITVKLGQLIETARQQLDSGKKQK